MSTIKKLAVLSMLVVAIIAFNIPASAAIGAGIGAGIGTRVGTAAGISSVSSISAGAAGIGIGGIGGGFGAFGGFGFPFNWGFSQLGIGCFPFNWGLGAGLGPLGLGWNHFTPGFGSANFFSPCFAGCTCQALPFITGKELACPLGPGFGVTPWAFGLGGCVRSMPLFFGAHGFGFPFSLGGFGASLLPSGCCGPVPVPVPVPACQPACAPVAAAAAAPVAAAAAAT